MNLNKSIAFFGIPGALTLAGVYLLVPVATAQGVPLILVWTTVLWGPVCVLAAFHLLVGFDNWKALAPIRKMTRKDWLIVACAFVGLQVAELLLAPIGGLVSGAGWVPLPPVIPELFSPDFDISSGLSTFLGVPVEGNWWLVLFWIGWLVVNIGGEEFLWRGYALPRQEKIFGKYAWLVNGLCWNLLFHAFMWWNFITLMPISLLLPYLVQRYRNIWIGVWLHGIGNLLVLALLIPAIAGWI